MHLTQLHVKIGLTSLNNDPLDFQNNFKKIMKSIQLCKEQNCSMRIGSELQVCGYSCHDHFSEYDTVYHSWDVIRDILLSKITEGIVVQVGSPILHKAALYNARIILFNNKVVAIRPKMILADGDNYFQTRQFASWKNKHQIGDFKLPAVIQKATGQKTVPIGVFIINFNDTSLAYQICQQSWISNNPMIDAALDGAQIFINPSASDIQKGKLKRKLQMIEQFTQRHGGAYCYVNLRGSVGDRTLFDGCCICTQNGKVKFLSEIHDLQEVSVLPIIVNLNQIRTFRLGNKSFQKESSAINILPRVYIDFDVATNVQECFPDCQKYQLKLKQLRTKYEHPHATYQPSIFLWELLKKSHARGFFLALSGGLDSCTVALIVYNMCCLVYKHVIQFKSQIVLKSLRKIVRDKTYVPKSPQQLCSQIFYTCYMGTQNSSKQTEERAQNISKHIGSNHRTINFDVIYKAFQTLGRQTFNTEIKFKKEGGSWRSDISLQNIQARSRMVLSYFIGTMELEQPHKEGFLLILGSSNLDQSLRGYFTKYDCSSADYNPIGSFSKNRLKQILKWNQTIHQFKFISQILNATPTAELRPLQQGQIAQTDQEDMGLTYDDLQLFGSLRKRQKLGPVSMFDRIFSMRKYQTRQLGQKIKKFFLFYGINRHKMTIVTPSFHYDQESCDDNRYDMRPIMYATDWKYQFQIIDERVSDIILKLVSKRSQELPLKLEDNEEE